MKIKWRSPSCVVVSFIVINSLMKSFGNMTSYQREVITVAGNYVSILLRRLEPVFLGVPSYFEALWYPRLYFYLKSNT